MKFFLGMVTVVIGFCILSFGVYKGVQKVKFSVSQEQNAIQETTTSHNTITLILGGIQPVNIYWNVTNFGARVSPLQTVEFLNSLDNFQALYAKIGVYGEIYYFTYTNVNKFKSVNTNFNTNTVLNGKSFKDLK